MKKLDKKVLKLWHVRNLFITVPVLLIFILVMVLVDNDARLAVALSLGTFTIVVVGLSILWPNLAYRAYSYDYDDLKITVKKGVIFKHNILIPVRQIQDLHIFDGPFMQLFKVSGLTISTAGSNFSINGINKLDADKIIEDLATKLESRLDADE